MGVELAPRISFTAERRIVQPVMRFQAFAAMQRSASICTKKSCSVQNFELYKMVLFIPALFISYSNWKWTIDLNMLCCTGRKSEKSQKHSEMFVEMDNDFTNSKTRGFRSRIRAIIKKVNHVCSKLLQLQKRISRKYVTRSFHWVQTNSKSS